MTTKIEWTDVTWNPTTGCSKISPGCKNCYAIKSARRMGGNPNAKIKARFAGMTERVGGELNWTGVVKLAPGKLADPLHWRKPRRVFVNSMSDLFHEGLSNEEIAAVFGVMAACPQHTFQVLTKRSERMREWFEWGGCEEIYAHWVGDTKLEIQAWPLPNVWLGVSVENQEQADKRIPDLLDCPAAVRFLSCEPLLGPLEIKHRMQAKFPWGRKPYMNANAYMRSHNTAKIDWVIVGGESGPKSRECDVAWIGSIVNQCKGEGCPVFVKQLGARSGVFYEDGSFDQTKLKDKKGGDPSEWPELLNVRQFPEVPNA